MSDVRSFAEQLKALADEERIADEAIAAALSKQKPESVRDPRLDARNRRLVPGRTR